MFMFRSKRSKLTKSLLKESKRRGNERPRMLLKRLQDNQLEMLLTAVQGVGKDLSNCVLLTREYGEEPPHVLCCQAWRWPDLRQSDELHQLPLCRSACDPIYICCNPYHYSRLYQPESPPPPYSRNYEDRIRPEDRAPSEVPLLCRDSYPGSLTTNGDSNSNNLAWCKLAYWELSQRIGPFFPVEPPAVNVFGDLPFGDGLCLQALAVRYSPPESVAAKTRCKIGLGVTLSRECDDRIWLYNRSDYPIFVSSLALDEVDPSSTSPSPPIRVPAEHCLCIFDPLRIQNYGDCWKFTHPIYGPVDPYSIRISFGKGWGPGYSRREITSCPCWLEILLAPCR